MAQDNDGDFMMNMDDDDMPLDDPPPSSPVVKAVERKQVAVKAEVEDEDDMMEVAQADGIVTASVNMSGKRPVPKISKTEVFPTPVSSSPIKGDDRVDSSAWTGVTSKLNVVNSSQSESTSFGKLDYTDAIEEDGSLKMFWTDYTEINGNLCLFGKVQNKKTGAFVSCFVKIDNILRKLFFLPREYRYKNKQDTTEEVDMKDVYEEVDQMMGKMRVGMHKIKPCSRKYAFELPDVPKEGDYLKLLYPYNSKSTPCLLPRPTDECRTTTATGTTFWTNLLACLWTQYAPFRAICSLEKYYGTLLVTNRRRRLWCYK